MYYNNSNNSNNTKNIYAADGRATSVMADDRAPTGVAPTVAAAELAWSDELPWIAAPQRSWGPQRSWAPVYAAAAVLIVGAAVLAASVAVGGWLSRLATSAQAPIATSATPSPSVIPAWAISPISPPVETSTVTVKAAPPPQETQTVTVPATPPSLSTDELFLATLKAYQITIYDRQAAVRGAHSVCWEFSEGKTRAQIIAESKPANPALSDLGLVDFISEAVAFYCPQYAGQ